MHVLKSRKYMLITAERINNLHLIAWTQVVNSWCTDHVSIQGKLD